MFKKIGGGFCDDPKNKDSEACQEYQKILKQVERKSVSKYIVMAILLALSILFLVLWG